MVVKGAVEVRRNKLYPWDITSTIGSRKSSFLTYYRLRDFVYGFLSQLGYLVSNVTISSSVNYSLLISIFILVGWNDEYGEQIYRKKSLSKVRLKKRKSLN